MLYSNKETVELNFRIFVCFCANAWQEKIASSTSFYNWSFTRMVHKIVRAHNKVVSIPNLIFWNFEKKTERWANEKRAGRSLSFSNYFFSSLFSSLNNVKWSTAAFVALTSFAIFFIIEGKWASKYFCHFRNSLRAVQIKSDLETLDTRGHAVLLILKSLHACYHS